MNHTYGLIFILLISLPNIKLTASELTDEEINKLKTDELIVKEQNIPGKPWPEMTIYTVINATPKEAFSIFAAYHKQKEYVPDIINSIPIKHISPTDVHIKFEMHMPWPLSNSFYTTGNRIKKIEDKSYAVEWYFVSSDSTFENRGEAKFLHFSKQTLLKYRTFIVPKSIFASFLKGVMKKNIRSTIKAIKNYIEKKSNGDKSTVLEYIKMTDEAFAGKNIFDHLIKNR